MSSHVSFSQTTKLLPFLLSQLLGCSLTSNEVMLIHTAWESVNKTSVPVQMEKTGLVPELMWHVADAGRGCPAENPHQPQDLAVLNLSSSHVLFSVWVEMTLMIISDAVTVTFKLNSEFQQEERESNIIWFLIFVLVLKCGHYIIVWISLGFAWAVTAEEKVIHW